ncbi:peptide chain release factor N(5)-glutamine methyltransferase [Reinekea thalattae]|uniref:Release factor glutamine methyltransferase n=1 Tax=Reinekea thalattae TaxID=2593301 RepID=A0A5C8Z7X4_9GAMM|nr:peptide chain release factor N(5)-glutamine methyltransferase [Reinekea thalattae]TXR53747.1 peptide chain release factor N(5)-glutamine methyltransferase [Reinekea thalattae]
MSQTIEQALSYAKAKGLDSLDAQVLLAHQLNKGQTYLIAWPEKQLSAEQLSAFQSLVEKRLSGEPVAYLTGVREFWSLPIQTSKATLIPRPDTEVLVETVLQNHSAEPIQCLDLGTGTGAIALALKVERPAWRVTGVDRMPEAVVLAKQNAQQLALDVHFYQAHWCQSVVDQSLDLIVSNPPYIDAEDEHLSQGDVRFEPKSALVADEHGLADIRIITQQARRCLKQAGALYIEHGWQQADDVRQLMIEAGFSEVGCVKDYAGNDRVTYGQLK